MSVISLAVVFAIQAPSRPQTLRPVNRDGLLSQNSLLIDKTMFSPS